jgi:UDP-N-acetylmuramoyl-tripeptide--D-alanyl-D-alanine ligase
MKAPGAARDDWMLDTATAAALVGGRALGGNVPFRRVSSDSRSLEPGDLFVALRGERFDGHDYVPSALAQGAAAALVADARAGEFAGPLIAVADPLFALGRLAAAWRSRFALPLAVVVGSNGKTTVKEMTAAILCEHFGEAATLATRGNLNNAIGLPLTLLRLRAAHQAAVVELGMNHRGETGELAAIAQPTIATINNAQREHQEFMRTVSEVADEHADAIRALSANGVAVVNADDPHVLRWQEAARDVGASVVTFGVQQRADIAGRLRSAATGSALTLTTPDGEADIALAIPGRHMAMNALAATATALAAGAPLHAVVRALTAFRPVPGRLAVMKTESGATVIDDSYNANPDSVRAAIDVLAAAPHPRWLVLGDMGEVGVQGPAFHREIGTCAREAGIDRMLAVGVLMQDAVEAFGSNAQHYASVEALEQALAGSVPPTATVLVKGSRFMAMERIVAALKGAGRGAH